MRKIIYVTGGQRSGKSAFAQAMAERLAPNPIYLATARHWDADFDRRIALHQRNRGEHWTTLEEEKELSKHDLTGRTVMMDCVTLWLTNLYCDHNYDIHPAMAEAKEEWARFIDQDMTLIVVSNEIGMGTHAPDEASRHFADMQGWINQHIAATSDEAYFLVSGIPIKIK